METRLRFVHWQDGEYFLGYLVDYPDYWTQGMSLEELQEQLASLLDDLTRGDL
jgi:predicted RNase H-like HicB family nuclease